MNKENTVKMDNTDKIARILNSCPEWFKRHPDNTPWRQGIISVRRRLFGWRKKYSPKVYDSFVFSEDSADPILGRLLTCWILHWKSAGEKFHGDDVAQNIENGKGYCRNGSLGGNPFFDLILAAALCDMQRRANDCYTKEYMRYLKGIAGKYDARCRSDADMFPEWWNPFYFYLVRGSEKQENGRPALLSYAGKSGLKGWLARALLTFLPKWLKKEFSNNADVMEQDYGTEERPMINDAKYYSLFERLKNAIRQARSSLTREEKTRLFLYYIDGMKNKAVALLFNETESTATRRRTDAMNNFKTCFFTTVQKDAELEETLSELFPNLRNDLTSLFFEEFKSEKENSENEDETKEKYDKSPEENDDANGKGKDL